MSGLSKVEIAWEQIDAVLLDMDGTLLDLHYDNYFWEEYLPVYYAKVNNLSLDESKFKLTQESNKVKGTLNWYCLDYWSELLSIDILEVKSKVDHKIEFRPNSVEFLEHLNKLNKRVILATNAHPKTLELKLLKKDFSSYFESLSSSHQLGHPKEEQAYWQKLTDKYNLIPERCLFVDDSVRILKSAQEFGIGHLLAISLPDSQREAIDCTPFTSINDYSQIL